MPDDETVDDGQIGKLRDTVNGPTDPDEPEHLAEVFGPPDENGVYGAPDDVECCGAADGCAKFAEGLCDGNA